MLSSGPRATLLGRVRPAKLPLDSLSERPLPTMGESASAPFVGASSTFGCSAVRQPTRAFSSHDLGSSGGCGSNGNKLFIRIISITDQKYNSPECRVWWSRAVLRWELTHLCIPVFPHHPAQSRVALYVEHRLQ